MRLLLVLAALLSMAVPALAAKAQTTAERAAARKVIHDCVTGRSLRRHSTRAILLARRTLPTDVSEYSDCQDRIAGALRARRYVRPRGPDRVASVLADCRDRFLDRRYPRATLLRAHRHLRSADRRACGAVIARDLRR